MQLPVSATDAELEERIIQHLAAAAAMGRARNIARREGQRSRSAQGRPHFLVFSTHPNAPAIAPMSSSTSSNRGEGESAPAVTVVRPTSSLPTSSLTTVGEDSDQLGPQSSSQADRFSASASGSSVIAATHHGTSSNNQYLLSLNFIRKFSLS